MCAILFCDDPAVNEVRFRRALARMTHRGPDMAGGYAAFDNVQLGHNRLKILDLDSRSDQPFFSADGRWVIVYNGEVYNYRELAEEYELSLRTTSDTEVVLELFIRLGPSALEKFNGMFAFIIFDKRERKIFAARDRLGIKPLYWARRGDNVIFASEMAGLTPLLDMVQPNEWGIRQYRKLRTFFNGHTVVEGVEMFPAGYCFSDDRLSCYWRFPEEENTPPSDEELRDLLESAVRSRCLADVEVGSYLSGGLDSTIVALLSRKPHTWTVGFSDYNEFEYAREAAVAFGSRHHEVLLDYDEFIPTAERMIDQRQEPLSVPNEVLLYRMTQKVKEFNTVVLSGEGADELFFGYDRIFRWAAHNPWDLDQFASLYAYGSHDDNEIVDDAVSPFYKYGSCLNIVAAFFQVAHLHGLLRRLDNATMMCSVEARVPFVDHRLVERMAGVPFEYRMEQGIVKAPLKRIFRDRLPESVVLREKVGFPVPLAKIFRDPPVTAMDSWLTWNLGQLGMEGWFLNSKQIVS